MAVSEVYNEDCMIGMGRYPDKFFDLAIVDPPYGIDFMHYNRPNKTPGLAAANKIKYHTSDELAITPNEEYFKELKRVSKHQIIWGGNYFIDFLESTSCFIVWDKKNENTGFADCELAWTSFGTAVRKFDYRWNGMLQENMKAKEVKIHPTQKPVHLYKWLLKNYADGWEKILDTHLGSGSSRIAAYDMGFDFYGWEIDKDYFEASCKRFEDFKKQGNLFRA